MAYYSGFSRKGTPWIAMLPHPTIAEGGSHLQGKGQEPEGLAGSSSSVLSGPG